jgi:hypothetical protein
LLLGFAGAAYVLADLLWSVGGDQRLFVAG